MPTAPSLHRHRTTSAVAPLKTLLLVHIPALPSLCKAMASPISDHSLRSNKLDRVDYEAPAPLFLFRYGFRRPLHPVCSDKGLPSQCLNALSQKNIRPVNSTPMHPTGCLGSSKDLLRGYLLLTARQIFTPCVSVTGYP